MTDRFVKTCAVILTTLVVLSCGHLPVKNGEYTSIRIPLCDSRELPFRDYIAQCSDKAVSVRLDSTVLLDPVRVKVDQDRIYLSDRKMQQLLCVSKSDGRLLSRIGHYGRAENEFLQVSGFDTDDNGNIWVLDARRKCILQYDRNTFQLILKKNLNVLAMDIKCLPGSRCVLFILPDMNESARFQLMVMDKELSPEYSLLPFPEHIDSESLLMARSFNDYDSSHFFTTNMYIDDYAHLVDMTGEIKQQYEFDFGRYRIPDNVRENIASYAEEFSHFRCACAPVGVTESVAWGQLFDMGRYSFFVNDRLARSLYIPEDQDGPISLVGGDSKFLYLYLPSAPESRYFDLLGISDRDADYMVFIPI